MTADEYRHVGTQSKAEFEQGRRRQAEFPDYVQGNQDGSSIRAAAPEAPAQGNPLADIDVRAQLAPAGEIPQSLRGAHDEIGLGRHAGSTAVAQDLPVAARREGNLVAEVDELKRRLQLVVAIRTAPDDVQEQVQLGRRRPGQATRERRRQAHGAWNSQRSTTTRMRAVSRVAVIRPGSQRFATSNPS